MTIKHDGFEVGAANHPDRVETHPTMGLNALSRKLGLALSLLAIAYTLLGWYLAAHHVFWLVSTFVILTTLFFAWKRNPLLEFLAWLIRQQVIVLIGVSLLLSSLVALTLVEPMLFSLIPLPLITLLYALLELRAAEVDQLKIFFWSVIVTGLGLGLGEAIDLLITPSMRY
ncbi:MAG: hypothetical protein NW220_19905 [Leptolyngbyaceae cyanobacterium bins.349]|nr:hypothetical protein [Leptolyngbyaceae cyanobacterium bins.349]